MGDLKAPGVDGMSVLFYKQFWDIVGGDVTREVKKLLSGGVMLEGWNDTMVVLSNHLKIILPDIRSLNQSALVPGRMITDNVLLAYEMTHFVQTQRGAGESYATVKLDMSKAYDREEWQFLEKMMCKLGFFQQWVDTIMKCVTTVKNRIKVNDELSHPKIFDFRM